MSHVVPQCHEEPYQEQEDKECVAPFYDNLMGLFKCHNVNELKEKQIAFDDLFII